MGLGFEKFFEHNKRPAVAGFDGIERFAKRFGDFAKSEVVVVAEK